MPFPAPRQYLTAAPGETLLRARMGPDAVDSIRARMASHWQSAESLCRCIRPATSWGPRRSAWSGGRSLGGLGRLQTRARPHLRAVRTAALPHLRHRIHLRPAHLSLARRSRDVWPQSTPGGAPIARPAKPACCSPIRWARRSACWPALDASIGPIAAHEAIERYNAIYRGQGIALPRRRKPLPARRRRAAPHSAPPWARPLRPDASTALASGWMRIRGTRRRRSLDRGFVLSDHADWPALLRAIDETARRDRLGDARLSRPAGALAGGARPPRARRGDSLRADGRRRSERPSPNSTPRSTRPPRPTRRSRRWRATFPRRPPEDAAWAVYFLIGRRPKRLLESRKLAQWAIEEAGVPDWLFGECYQAVGDFAETIALLLPPAADIHRPAAALLGGGAPAAAARCRRRHAPRLAGRRVARNGRAPALRLEQAHHRRISRGRLAEPGGARAGRGQRPSRGSHRAPAHGRLAAHARFLARGSWRPTRAMPMSAGPTLSSWPIRWKAPSRSWAMSREWQVEWKWDGIRAQLIRRGGRTFLWSRGEELITDRFPELEALGALLPDGTVIDGEMLPWKDGAPLPFAQMQRRIGRKALGPQNPGRGAGGADGLTTCWNCAAKMCANAPLEWRRAATARRSRRPGAPWCSRPWWRPASWEELAQPARAVAGAQGGRLHAEAARLALPRGPAARRLVEVEDRAVLGGRRADLRAARQRPARQPVHRLHLRRLGRAASWCRSPKPTPA